MTRGPVGVAMILVAAAVAGVWWVARDGGGSGANTGSGVGVGSGSGSGVGSGSGDASGVGSSSGSNVTARPGPSRVPVAPPADSARDAAREKLVADTLASMLVNERALYEVKTITCSEAGQCHVELEVNDMDAFRSPYAKLSEPGGFPESFGAMVLQKPEPIPGAAPKAARVRFALLPKVPE